jgi:NitT/TauT family transport system ATP-binding protein
MLIIENIFFAYDDSSFIFENISINCERGEIIAVLGRSGVGKTTLFNLVCGYQTGYSGTISIGGMNPDLAARHCAIGYVFQSPTLIPWLTVHENIALPLKLHSRSKTSKEIDNEVFEVMHLAKIDRAAQLFPNQLSGGMQTRAALARALVYSPSLLLLDEPFSALDDIVKEEIYTDLQAYLTRTKTATIIVTHNLSEAIRLSERIYVLARRNDREPTRIVACKSVPFPKPRNMDVMRSERFHEIREHLIEIL